MKTLAAAQKPGRPPRLSVSVVSNKSWAGNFFSSGSIAIHVGAQTYEVDFRGDQKSHHVHNVILWQMGIRPAST